MLNNTESNFRLTLYIRSLNPKHLIVLLFSIQHVISKNNKLSRIIIRRYSLVNNSYLIILKYLI